MRRPGILVFAAVLCAGMSLPVSGHADDVEAVVAQVIQPLMEREGIPGMAVGVALDGRSVVFKYGTASRETRKPVTDDTLFEVGSVSKTFTATLAAYAQASGQLSLSDTVGKDFPDLRGSRFDEVSLLNLGTHTSGGLPLQVPDEVTNDEQLIGFLRQWKPAHAPGTHRTYSNVSIGLLGRIAAKCLQGDFTALMEGKLFPALGLKNTFLHVPADRMDDYAQGYTPADVPARLSPGVLDAEAYGVRTTAGDLLRFVEVNMSLRAPADKMWQSAIAATHIGYYRLGGMTQDLIWEQYPYPSELTTLLAGNSQEMIYEANPAVRLDPPLPPQEDVLINKTGTTKGFATYVAFVPAGKLGVVLLANKSYPIDTRVTAVREILSGLEKTRGASYDRRLP